MFNHFSPPISKTSADIVPAPGASRFFIAPKFQCGFQKGFNTQHCLMTIIEKCPRPVNGGGQAGAFLFDLLKFFIVLTSNC